MLSLSRIRSLLAMKKANFFKSSVYTLSQQCSLTLQKAWFARPVSAFPKLQYTCYLGKPIKWEKKNTFLALLQVYLIRVLLVLV